MRRRRRSSSPLPADGGVLNRLRRRPPMRLSALYLMLFGATVIVGAAGVGAPVTPLPRLFAALVAWLVGCLSLLVPLPPP